MKYYAVTNDPAELMHYGIKGMKWGVIRSDAQLGHPRKSRSAAYKKASGKLGKLMKSGIKKAEAHWQEYNSPASKRDRAKRKEARKMEKYIQQARTGTLKYGKLTDAQVKRVTERLALERNARQLGSTEKQKFSSRIKSAIGEGVVRGVTQGTAGYMEERLRARGRYKAEKKWGEKLANVQAKEQAAKEKVQERYEAKSSTQRRKAKAEANQAYYKMLNEEGIRGGIGQARILPGYKKRRAAMVKAVNERNEAEKLAKEDAKDLTRRQRDLDNAVEKAYRVTRSSNKAIKENEADNKARQQFEEQQESARKTLASGDRHLGTGSALARLSEYNETVEQNNARLNKTVGGRTKRYVSADAVSRDRVNARNRYRTGMTELYSKADKRDADRAAADYRKRQEERAEKERQATARRLYANELEARRARQRELTGSKRITSGSTKESERTKRQRNKKGYTSW